MDEGAVGPLQPPFEEIEEAFNRALDESLEPRGPGLMFDYVESLHLAAGSSALDVGCGAGRHSIELARRFGLRVLGLDPVPAHLAEARAGLEKSGLSRNVRFAGGAVEDIPAPDEAFDLVWCRDVLSLVDDLDRAYQEIHRVLRPGGKALVYVMTATPRLEPGEARTVFGPLAVVDASMRPARIESAIRQSGLLLDRCEVLGTEWGEYDQEHTGKPGRNLLHMGRLLRQRERYVERFGEEYYEVKVADCLWHVYRLIGKLSSRLYALSKA
jgi:SAM-dependent methyltransferase